MLMNLMHIVTFQERFMSLYKADVDKKGEHFATQKELIEFTNDGLNIIDFFLKI